MKASLVVAALAAFLITGSTSSQALPAGPISKSIQQNSSSVLEPVHWRRWRHCHWRRGWRRCHGYRGYRRYGYGYYRPYYYRPYYYRPYRYSGYGYPYYRRGPRFGFFFGF